MSVPKINLVKFPVNAELQRVPSIIRMFVRDHPESTRSNPVFYGPHLGPRDGAPDLPTIAAWWTKSGNITLYYTGDEKASEAYYKPLGSNS